GLLAADSCSSPTGRDTVATIFVYGPTLATGNRTWRRPLKFENCIRRRCKDGEHALLFRLQHETVVYRVVVRVRDLNGGHFRFHFPILWDQNPPFFVDAALGVSRDAPLVDGGYRAAIGEDSDPLSLQQQRKRRIHFRRD